MPSKRHRSASRERSRSPSRDRSRSASPERSVSLPYDASEISESDYFQKSDEFRVWLKDEKRKYLDELTGERSRKYFRKFVKAWNRGKLPKTLYVGVEAQPASSNTAYKWSFASKVSAADTKALRTTRDEVDAATYQRPSYSDAGPSNSGSRRQQGPTLPSQADLTLAREAAEEVRSEDRELKRKRERKEHKERVEDAVGPKEVGREGMLETKRAKREADRAFRDKGDDGLEANESTLLGGGDSFKDHIARRDAARKRREEQRGSSTAAVRERADNIRQKDKATMDMFMQMAKEKFG